jgi:hypothetical protein
MYRYLRSVDSNLEGGVADFGWLWTGVRLQPWTRICWTIYNSLDSKAQLQHRAMLSAQQLALLTPAAPAVSLHMPLLTCFLALCQPTFTAHLHPAGVCSCWLAAPAAAAVKLAVKLAC